MEVKRRKEIPMNPITAHPEILKDENPHEPNDNPPPDDDEDKEERHCNIYFKLLKFLPASVMALALRFNVRPPNFLVD